MSKRLKGVCLGAGYFARFQYEAWNRIPDVDIVALSNRNPERAAAAAERHGVPKVYAWAELELSLIHI